MPELACSQCDSPILIQLSHRCHFLLDATSVCSSPLLVFGTIEYCSIFKLCHQPCKVLDTLKPYTMGLTIISTSMFCGSKTILELRCGRGRLKGPFFLLASLSHDHNNLKYPSLRCTKLCFHQLKLYQNRIHEVIKSQANIYPCPLSISDPCIEMCSRESTSSSRKATSPPSRCSFPFFHSPPSGLHRF